MCAVPRWGVGILLDGGPLTGEREEDVVEARFP